MANFVPGYTVAKTLDDILTQKRLEKRQAALDEVNKQNVQSEIQSRADAADTNRMYRQAYADQRESNIGETDRKAKALSDEKLALTNFISDPQFATMDPKAQTAYKIALASGDHGTVKTLISKYLTPEKPATRQGGYIWTSDRNGNPYNTGQFMEGVQGDQFHEQPAPQQGSYSDAGPEQDAAGQPTGNRVFFNQHSGSYGIAPIKFGPKSAAKGNENTPIIPPTQAKDISTKRRKATPTGGFLGMGGTPNVQDVAAYESALNLGLANARTTPQVKSAAHNILAALMQHPNSAKDNGDVIVAKQTDPSITALSPLEKQHLANIIDGLK